MRTIKNKLSAAWFIALFMVSCYSCDKNVYHFEYYAEPKTETGRKLVDGTDLFAQIFSDTTYAVADGVSATEIQYLSQKGLAMKLFVFDIDLSHPDVSIEVATPFGLPAYAMQPMTVQAIYADAEGHRVWGGINADFFNMSTGEPRGILYKKGEAIRTRFDSGTRSFFAINKAGKAFVAPSEDYPAIAADDVIHEAVGGSVMLVRDGNVVKHTDTTVEPRTCIGVTSDSTRVFMVAVDGRNFSYSNGMLFEELGQCLKALGAANGINLDGGGSTTFFIRNTPAFTESRFELRNWPSDNGGKERAVANGLLIISK